MAWLRWFIWAGSWSPAVALGVSVVMAFEAAAEDWGSFAIGGVILAALLWMATQNSRG